MSLKVKLLARPDHSVSLYDGLRAQGILVDYRTFFAFTTGGLLATLLPRRKQVSSGARISFSFTFLAYTNNWLGKRLGFNWRKSETLLASRLLAVGDLRKYQIVHYWPFYYSQHIRSLEHVPSKSRPVTLAEFYEAEPVFVNTLYKRAYEQVGLAFNNPINLMIDQNSAFTFEKNFCVPSNFTKQSYLQKFPDARIHVVGYGLMGRKVKQVRKKIERRRWVFVGQVCLEKGIHVLLDAMTELPELSLDIIGPLRQGQQKYFKDRFTQYNNVRWLGPKTNIDVKACLSEYDAFVLPSLADAYSIAVIEALSEGLPVVVTDHCGVADEVTAYGLGRVCKAGNVNSLISTLSEVTKDFDSVVFEQGLRQFEMDETEKPYAVRMRALYEKLIER